MKVSDPGRELKIHGLQKCAYALSVLVETLYDPTRRIETTEKRYVMGILLNQDHWLPVTDFSWLDHWFEPRERTA